MYSMWISCRKLAQVGSTRRLVAISMVLIGTLTFTSTGWTQKRELADQEPKSVAEKPDLDTDKDSPKKDLQAKNTGSSSMPKSLDDLREIQSDVRSVVKQARMSTVSVEMNGSAGSGIIISPDGLVLTAGHVCIEPNKKVWVRFPDDRRFLGRTLGVNHNVDSGLVQIIDFLPKGKVEWPHTPLCNEPVEIGEWVVGLGHPNGYEKGRLPPVRLGRVLFVREDTISTDVTLVGGDSGGPLFNLAGEVVAIHSRIGRRITDNLHVPVGSYQKEWEELVAGRMYGQPNDDDPEDARPLIGLAARMVQGRCLVTQVFPNRPADEAGVRVDDIILRIDDEPITSIRRLQRLTNQLEPFDRVKIKLLRKEKEIEVEVWIARTNRWFPGIDGAEERK